MVNEQGRKCLEAIGELTEAAERMARMLARTHGSPGAMADGVYSVITQAKAGVVLLEQAHLDLTVVAGRPAGTGPEVTGPEVTGAAQGDVTREQLAAALEGFYVRIRIPLGVMSAEIADADETAGVLHATLSRMAALRDTVRPGNGERGPGSG